MGGEPVYRSIESGADNLGLILRSIILSGDRDCGNWIGGRTEEWFQESVQNQLQLLSGRFLAVSSVLVYFGT